MRRRATPDDRSGPSSAARPATTRTCSGRSGDQRRVGRPDMQAGRYDVAAGTPWLFARDDMVGVRRCPFRRRGRPDVARQRHRDERRGAVRRPARRSQPAAAGQPGRPSGGCRRIGARALVGRRCDHRRSSSASFSTRPVGCIRPSTATSRRRSTTVGSGPHPSTACSGSIGRASRWRRHPLSSIDHAGNGSSSRQEADGGGRAVASVLGQPWTDRHGRVEPIEVEDLIVVAPYNAHVAADPRRDRAAARARDARARRHGRQVPGPGGRGRDLLDGELRPRTRHAAWTSFTAATGSTSPSLAHGRSRWSSRVRGCSMRTAERPSRCGS